MDMRVRGSERAHCERSSVAGDIFQITLTSLFSWVHSKDNGVEPGFTASKIESPRISHLTVRAGGTVTMIEANILCSAEFEMCPFCQPRVHEDYWCQCGASI